MKTFTLRMILSTTLFNFVILHGLVQAQTPAPDETTADTQIEIKIQKIEGWTVKIEQSLLDEDPELAKESIAALTNHLQRVRWVVGPKRLEELKTLPIWLGHHHPRLDNMQYHPSAGWLKQNGHDPRMEKHVHIPRAKQLLERNMWTKHPYVVLHELAHAYHDQILGFNHPEIIAAYKSAKKRGGYDDVMDHRGNKVKHYGMNNQKEYFAESTEAYFGVNDFFPFVRAELKQHDPEMHSLLSKIWGPLR